MVAAFERTVERSRIDAATGCRRSAFDARSDGGDSQHDLASVDLVTERDRETTSQGLVEPNVAEPGRRKKRSLVSRPFMLVVTFASALVGVGLHRSAPAFAAAVEHRMLQGAGRNTVAQRAYFGEEGALHEDVRRLSMGIDRAGRGSAPMQRLQSLDPTRVRMPKDLALFADELARFVDAAFVDPTAKQELMQHGYPTVVAAVAVLQELDYADRSACAKACRLHGLLTDITGVEGLEPEEPLADPDDPTFRRFCAAAVAWRRVLERHARDESAFSALLVLTKRGKPVEKKD